MKNTNTVSLRSMKSGHYFTFADKERAALGVCGVSWTYKGGLTDVYTVEGDKQLEMVKGTVRVIPSASARPNLDKFNALYESAQSVGYCFQDVLDSGYQNAVDTMAENPGIFAEKSEAFYACALGSIQCAIESSYADKAEMMFKWFRARGLSI